MEGEGQESKIIKFQATFSKKPQERTGQASGKILDFQESREKRIKACLENSSVSPKGKAYKEVFVNGPRKYYVIALVDHYSEQAVKMVNRLLTTLKPVAMIVEGCDYLSGVPEVDFAKEEGKRLEIPVLDVIVPPYNPVIAREAEVKPEKALEAIILAEIYRYEENPDLIITHLSRSFNIHPNALEVLVISLTRKIKEGVVSLESFKPIFNKLVQVSNDLSWHRLQEVLPTLGEGDVIAIVGGMHSKIFDTRYRPEKRYSREELNEILRSVESFERGIKTVLSPKGSEQSIPELFGDEDFFREWERLSEELKSHPENEVARQRLKTLLTKKYEELMERGKFFYAAQRARGLVKAGIPEGQQMLITALKKFYFQSMDNGWYTNAFQAAEELSRLGVEGSDILLEEAKKKRDSQEKTK